MNFLRILQWRKSFFELERYWGNMGLAFNPNDDYEIFEATNVLALIGKEYDSRRS
ncbi:MAG: hypothetical protein MK193_13890 [Lentisphaeria bacterium]|nr:hypothetical protein [Lentisphaeria bacterium]